MAAKFQSQARRAEMAVQLDRGAREIPSQELDAQPPALAARRRRHRELDSLGARRMAGQGRGAAASIPRKSRRPSTSWSSSMSPRAAASRRPTARRMAVSLSEVDDLVEKKLTLDEKLLYLGEKTISRLGCFGCHTIPGFENAKPIGTALNDWGIKLPARLDFGHIKEYLTDQEQAADVGRQPRRHRSVLSREGHAREPDGLPLSEAASAAQLRLSEEEREVQDVGRPPPHAAVRLGQRSGRGRRGDDLRARADQREGSPPGISPRRTPRRRGRRWPWAPGT